MIRIKDNIDEEETEKLKEQIKKKKQKDGYKR